MPDPNTLYCSFCGKSQHEVGKLVAGPRVFICGECVDLCHSIVHEQPGAARDPGRALRRAEILLDLGRCLDGWSDLQRRIVGYLAELAREEQAGSDGPGVVVGFGKSETPPS
jgi:hypothetical protein